MAKGSLIPNYCILDFETGGLAKGNKVNHASVVAATQVALILVDGVTLEEYGRYQEYIAPYDLALEYQPKAAEITGVDRAFVEKHGKPLETVVNNIAQLIDTHNKSYLKTVIVGQNVMYDVDFLCEIFRRRKADVSAFFNCDRVLNVCVPRSIDIMDLAKLADTGSINYKLGTLCKAHGIDYVDAHDAMNDIQFTLDIFKNLMLRLQGGEDLFHGDDIKSTRGSFQF